MRGHEIELALPQMSSKKVGPLRAVQTLGSGSRSNRKWAVGPFVVELVPEQHVQLVVGSRHCNQLELVLRSSGFGLADEFHLFVKNMLLMALVERFAEWLVGSIAFVQCWCLI